MCIYTWLHATLGETNGKYIILKLPLQHLALRETNQLVLIFRKSPRRHETLLLYDKSYVSRWTYLLKILSVSWFNRYLHISTVMHYWTDRKSNVIIADSEVTCTLTKIWRRQALQCKSVACFGCDLLPK